jgi:sortase A
MLIPVFANVQSYLEQQKSIQAFNKVHQKMSAAEKKKEKAESEAYNKKIAKNELSVSKFKTSTYQVGVLKIPVINVKLPIYNGTKDWQLNKGAGLMNKTSMPMGGNGIHTVIAAHRGNPRANQFSDLPLLKIGDQFNIKTSYGTFWYEVDRIKTVLPEDTQYLEIENNKNYTTLVTCTPYMINSHRLLVRGKLIDKPATDKVQKMPKRGYEKHAIIIASILLLFLIAIRIFIDKKKEKNDN